MASEVSWRVLLHEFRDRKSRLIFTDSQCRRLIDITIHSQCVDNIISTVVKSNWNAEQVMAFLNIESEKMLPEALEI